MERGSSVAGAWRRVLRDQWLVLSRPSLAAFQEATAPVGGWELALAVAPASVLTGLLRLAGRAAGQGPLEAFAGGVLSNLVAYCMLAGVLLAGVALLHSLAEVLLHLYALGLFWPVLNILLGAPGWGWLVWFGAALYGLYLSYLALRVVHALPPARARLVAIIPIILGALAGLGIWLVLFLLTSGTILTVNP